MGPVLNQRADHRHDYGIRSAERRIGEQSPRTDSVCHLDVEFYCSNKAAWTFSWPVNRLRAAAERAISHLENWKILQTGYHRIKTDFPTCYAPSPPWRRFEPPRRV
jgi:hypothetical protein